MESTESRGAISDAIWESLTSRHVKTERVEEANVVEVLDELSRKVDRIGDQLVRITNVLGEVCTAAENVSLAMQRIARVAERVSQDEGNE